MKKKTGRIIPNVNIYPLEIAPVDAIAQADVVLEIVHTELLPAIKQAIKSKRTSAVLFQINSSDAYVEIPKTEWLKAIDKNIAYFTKKEKYEVCSDLTTLKTNLKEADKQLV